MSIYDAKAYLGKASSSVRVTPELECRDTHRSLECLTPMAPGEIIFMEPCFLDSHHSLAIQFNPIEECDIPYDFQRLLYLYIHHHATPGTLAHALVQLIATTLSTDGMTSTVANMEIRDRMSMYQSSLNLFAKRLKQRMQSSNIGKFSLNLFLQMDFRSV
jgi:hypothetical protein